MNDKDQMLAKRKDLTGWECVSVLFVPAGLFFFEQHSRGDQ